MLGPHPKRVHVVSSYRCVVQLLMCQACGLRESGRDTPRGSRRLRPSLLLAREPTLPSLWSILVLISLIN